jgi:Pentapeptide repeats (9 copies)
VEAAAPAEDRDRAPHGVPGQDPAEEELQVRETAQRILAHHLQAPEGASSTKAPRRRPSPRQAFWPGISLDLTGATLVDLDFARVSVMQALFDRATFQGEAGFDQATFQGAAGFDQVTFQGEAGFDQATFQGAAGFNQATFQSAAWFNRATFQVPWGEIALPGQLPRAQSPDPFYGARVLHLDDPDLDELREWPDGFTIRRDEVDPTRGTLVPAQQVEEPRAGRPLAGPTGRSAD